MNTLATYAGFFVGGTAVCFIEMFIVLLMAKSIIKRRKLSYEVKPFKHAFILAVMLFVIRTFVNARIADGVSVTLLLITLIVWLISLLFPKKDDN